MKLNTLLSALLVAALPGLAIAAAQEDTDSTKRIDKRQQAQEKRIESGVKSGDLTKKEAARLEKRQDRIDAAEKEAMKDGKMTKEERARIEKMQDKQARDIRKQRDDKQERGAAAKQRAATGTSTAATAHPSGTATVGQLTTLIAAEEKKAMADGRISAEERVRLDKLYAERDRREKQKD